MKKIVLFQLAFALFLTGNSLASEETLLGDSSIFGKLKKLHTASFSGERKIIVIDDKIILFQKGTTQNTIEALRIPSLETDWTINGSYFFVQPCEGKTSYAILYRGDSEGPGIDVYELNGEKLFSLENHDGGIAATPNGEIFYPHEWGINGTDGTFYNRKGETVQANLRCFGSDFVARSLNDSILVTSSYFHACIFSITNGQILDSISRDPNTIGFGCVGRAARSRYGGHVLFNWCGNNYYVDSNMQFTRINDTTVYAQIVRISDDGKFGFILEWSLERIVVIAYNLAELKRIWTEELTVAEGNRIWRFDLNLISGFLVVPYESGSFKSLVFRIDPATGQQTDKVLLNENTQAGNIGKRVFTVSTEISNNSTKLTLRVWE